MAFDVPANEQNPPLEQALDPVKTTEVKLPQSLLDRLRMYNLDGDPRVTIQHAVELYDAVVRLYLEGYTQLQIHNPERRTFREYEGSILPFGDDVR